MEELIRRIQPLRHVRLVSGLRSRHDVVKKEHEGFRRPSSDDSMSAKPSSSRAIVRLVYMFSPYHISGGSGSYPVCVSVSEPSACRLRNPHCWCVTGSPLGHPLCFDICRPLHDHIACTTAASSMLVSRTDIQLARYPTLHTVQFRTESEATARLNPLGKSHMTVLPYLASIFLPDEPPHMHESGGMSKSMYSVCYKEAVWERSSIKCNERDRDE
ncbi:uncharacterized protein BO88DRAFT_109943 [Aspergillus vadensis CBS 113365]|uniref:Uncharacterized protein n=1 Tax=Aspergillus vadensis (strain CBS 113365 / IMI 142717 / IBT 24658) TaxID=1448311 RepID=A0A319BNQ1_ASPVC|nr:hypothetical protein BO88DRAFT_109943 [Aspergillus vadensis CBS 113365]PYH73974.1 hypothetical protein BO88DRAFT_109943 [Aspergillus vadensis CBS 113365]